MKTILAATVASTVLLGAQAAAQAGAKSIYGGVGATTNEGFDDGAVTGRVGSTFGEHFGAEGEVSYFVDSEVGFAAAYATGRLPAGGRLTILGRVGYGLFTDLDDAEGALAYGIGAETPAGPRGAVRADYTRIDAGDGFDEEGFFTVTYQFRLGGAQR